MDREQVKVSTGYSVPSYKENQKTEDTKKLRDKLLKDFWGGKTPQQKKEAKDKEIEELINKKKK